MEDDDDWGLSMEELDSLEKDAVKQLKERRRSSSFASVPYSEPHGCSTSILVHSPQKSTSTSGTVLSSPMKISGSKLRVQILNSDRTGKVSLKTAYNKDLVAALKTVPGYEWDPNQRVWTYPEDHLGALVRAIESIAQPKILIDIVVPLSLSPVLDAQKGSIDPGAVNSRIQTVSKSSLLDGDDDESPLCNSQLQIQTSQDSCTAPVVPTCFVKLFLHSSGFIAVRSDYNVLLVAVLKSIPSAEWHVKDRVWLFPFSSLPASEKFLMNRDDLNIMLEPLVPLVRRALEVTASFHNLEEKYRYIPEELETQLLPFQVDGVRFALQHGGRVLVADEMGLGKTLQAIAVVSCMKENWPVLIIVPSSLRMHWASTLVQWLKICPGDITIVMPQGSGSNRQGFNILQSAGKGGMYLNGLFVVLSYDIVSKLQDDLSRANFKIIIADESHYLKNPTAKRTAACVPLLQRAQCALLLTGTPALSRPIELYKQLEALQPAVYRNVHEYGERYCKGGKFGVYQGSSNHEELHALVKSTVMIRRLKKDVLSQLPDKRRQQVFIALDGKGTKQIQALFKELENVKRSIICVDSQEEIDALKYTEKQLISKIYTDSAEVKVPAVQDYLATILEGECKFLVFAHHQCMLDGIQDLLEKRKVLYIRIDGRTPAAARQTLVTKFQEKDNVRVAVLGIRAAGVGLTLTAASTVIFAEMSWTPGDLVQAEDRAHRIGQESSVNVYYLHAPDTIDDIIWDSVQHKLENLGQVLDGRESSLNVTSTKTHRHRQAGQCTLTSFLHPCNSNDVWSMDDEDLLSELISDNPLKRLKAVKDLPT